MLGQEHKAQCWPGSRGSWQGQHPRRAWLPLWFSFHRGISGCLTLFHSPLAGALLYFYRHWNKCNLVCIAVTLLNTAPLLCSVHGSGLSCRNATFTSYLELVPYTGAMRQVWPLRGTTPTLLQAATCMQERLFQFLTSALSFVSIY